MWHNFDIAQPTFTLFDCHKGNNLRMAATVPPDIIATVLMSFNALQVKMCQIS